MSDPSEHGKRAPDASVTAHAFAFPEHERQLLLRAPGISHGVVSRIERQGVFTLRQLLDRGIDAVVDQICRDEGNLVWRNRRRALARALTEIASRDPA